MSPTSPLPSDPLFDSGADAGSHFDLPAVTIRELADANMGMRIRWPAGAGKPEVRGINGDGNESTSPATIRFPGPARHDGN